MRLPFYWGGVDQHSSVLQLQHKSVGYQMNQSFDLYGDIHTTLGPLSGSYFYALDWLGMNTYVGHHILSFILFAISTFLFVRITQEYKSFSEVTYIPGLIFIVLGSMHFDFYSLHPLLIGMPFFLLHWQQNFKRIQFQKSGEDTLLYGGLFLGIASLAHVYYAFFIIPTIIYYLIFGSISGRKYILLIIGMLLPFFLGIMIFLYKGNINEFFYYFIFKNLWIESMQAIPYQKIIYLSIPMAILAIFGFLKYNGFLRFKNYQNNHTRLSLMYGLVALIVIVAIPDRTYSNLLVFLPVAAYLGTHAFLLMRKSLWAEIYFLLLLATVIFYQATSFNESNWMNTSSHLKNKKYGESSFQGKTILSTVEILPEMRHGLLAPAYMHQRIIKGHMNRKNDFESKLWLHHEITRADIDLIYDAEGLIKGWEDQIVELREFKKRPPFYIKD